MSAHIPAWKKIGLKVKETLEHDPLAITAHLDSGKVTKKQAKQINKRKLEDDDKEKKQKKTAKRVKLPKSERAPPPEKDQLVYLKQYSEDKHNWKFSKQKQNWILKHIKTIDDKYEDFLVAYLEGLQGGGRERLIERLQKVIESWNSSALEEPKEKEEAADEKPKIDEKEKTAPVNKDEQKEDLESVDADYAKRARRLVEAMTEEKQYLKGIDDDSEPQTKPEETVPQNSSKDEEKETEADIEEPKKDKKEKKKSKKSKKSKKDETSNE